MLVDMEWLEANLSNPNVRVVEVDVSPSNYDEWHIDGAVLWNIYSDLKDAEYRLIGAANVADLFERSGIGPDSTVVFYGYGPAIGFWLMKLYGHSDVRILNCSRQTLQESGFPRTNELLSFRRSHYEIPAEVLLLRADRGMVERAIDLAGTTILDVRTPAEYDGDRFWPSGTPEPNGRAGHVPSALNQPLDNVYNDDGSFRSATELSDIFGALDIDGDDEIITYCTIGGRATTAWFVLTYLLDRNNVRVYDGSWAEWGHLPDTPVARVRM